MYQAELEAVAAAAQGKSALLKKNPAGYFLLSMLAGFYVGFGVLLVFTISGQLQGAPHTKLVMGMCFAVALSLVIMAGSELFTGNMLVMGTGILKKKVSTAESLKLWCVCYAGNLAGSFLLAVIYRLTGLGAGAAGEAMAAGALAKISAGPLALTARGILCNMLVCVAVWCGFRCKSEPAKLIMVFWCILAFFTTGFEHSIANMTLFSYMLISPAGSGIPASGMLMNLLFVTIGNIIGGLCLTAVPYFISAKS